MIKSKFFHHVVRQLGVHDFLFAQKNKSFGIKSVIIKLLFVALLVGTLFYFLETYSFHSRDVLIRLYVLAAFLFALFCGYLLGSLKRDIQVWRLVNDLKQQILNKEMMQEKLLQGELRLQRQNACLERLGAVPVNVSVAPIEYFKQMVLESTKTLNVARASIWLYSKPDQAFICEVMYTSATKQYDQGQRLPEGQFSTYLNAIKQERVLVVNDAYHHPATVEFIDDYLPNHQVGAILDATIWIGNEVAGVICHEHVGATREWTLDEENFAGSLADLISLALEGFKRQQVEGDLLHQQLHLDTIVRTRTAVIESNAKLFRFLVGRAPVSILYMNRATEVIEMNPEVELVSGYSRDFALGKTFYELFSVKKIRASHLAIFKRILAGEKLQGQELLMRRSDGAIGEYSISASMEQDANGNEVIIAIAQDMAQQKLVEQALQKAREAAESADRIKSMFVASMSHELRTPLNSIIGFLGVVLHGMSGDINARQKDQLGRAYHSAKHLLSLISDVIDISKIEAGYLQVHIEKFELLPLLLEAEQVVRHIADEKKIDIEIDCAKEILIETDRKRLYQVVLNVLSNAVKYTERGSALVSVTLNNEQVIISIQDTGIGMNEAGLANLFKPFERVDSRLRIRTLGTGLGLYLTHKILTQLLAGTIEVSSTPEVGSNFTISLPIKAPKRSAENFISVLESTTK